MSEKRLKTMGERKRLFLLELFKLYDGHGVCIDTEDHGGGFRLVDLDVGMPWVAMAKLKMEFAENLLSDGAEPGVAERFSKDRVPKFKPSSKVLPPCPDPSFVVLGRGPLPGCDPGKTNPPVPDLYATPVNSIVRFPSWMGGGLDGTGSDNIYAAPEGSEIEVRCRRTLSIPEWAVNPPAPPAGCRWVARGFGWNPQRLTAITCTHYSVDADRNGRWADPGRLSVLGVGDYYYLEAVGVGS